MQMDLGQEEIGNKSCKTCAYHDDWTWVCFNPESDNGADFTDESYVCERWRDKPCEKKILKTGQVID